MLARNTAIRPAGFWLLAVMLLIGAPLVAAQGGEPGVPAGPAEHVVMEEGTLVPQALAWWRAPADAFVQYDDDAAWNYYGAGCIYRTGGTQWYDIDVQLPDGAEITHLRVYFYDNDAANDATALLFSFDGAGNYTQLATVSSSGTPGQSSEVVAFSHIVDTATEALAVRIAFAAGTSSSLRICGVRFQYNTP